MEFNKDEILDSIDLEVHNSFKKLLESIISILQESVKTGICIPTREVLEVTPYSRGFTKKKREKSDLYRLVAHKIWDLDEYKQCSETFDKNELLGSQGISSFLVLSSFIADYLDNIDIESIVFDQRRFDSLFDEYRNALLSFTYETVYICPLLGFESEIDSLKLDENLTLRKITVDELNEIGNLIPLFNYGNFLRVELMNVKYVLEQRVVQIKKNIQKLDIDLISTAVFTLRLLKNGKFLVNNRLYKSLLPWEIKNPQVYGDGNYHNSSFTHNKYLLSKNDVDDLKKYYLLSKRVQYLQSKNEYKQLFRAIEWFKRYHNESNTEHQFIFLMLLMEALCSDAVETQYRLSNRVSLIIGNDDKDRTFIIKNITEKKETEKGLYSIRSAIMHGGAIELDTNFYNRLKQAENYSRRLLQKSILISLNKYGTQDARTLIDNALVSETKRKELFKALNFDETYKKFNTEAKRPEPLYTFLKDELYEIKTDLDRFTVYKTNKGFIYKSVIINGLDGTFTESLWNEITAFYNAYFAYLILLKESSDLVRNIIQKTIHKIKTEEEASEWTRKYLEKINNDSPLPSCGASGKVYNLSNFLRKNILKNIPEINDDEYLFLDDFPHQWDLTITLEDIRRCGRSIEDIIQEIHNLVGREDLICEIRDSNVENLKMISSLIKHIEKFVLY